MLLSDVTSFDVVSVISENKSRGTMKIRGIAQRADEWNKNKRRYKRSLLEREVDKLQDRIQGRQLLGELDHPQYDSVKLANASHLVTNLQWDNNLLIGEAELLNTPAGKIAQDLIRDGVKLGWSSRGVGTLMESTDKPGFKEVNEDFNLITWDLVGDPSTKGAYLNLCESTDPDIQSRAKSLVSEKVFLKLLRDRLNG